MKKFLNILFAISLTITSANALSINDALKDSDINNSAISISVKDVSTGKTVYELNSRKPMNPASTLKVVTLASSLDKLGEDYEFATGLYKNTDNELILKLGADPFLTSNDLKNLFKTARDKNIIQPKLIKVDDTILDKTEWGEGWQWDDDLNPLMPKFSAYNIDKNLLTVAVAPTSLGAPAEIKLTKFYPTTFMNLVTSGNDSALKLSKNYNIAPDVLTLEGVVSKQTEISFPINYPKRYFMLRLEDAVRSAKIDYYGGISTTIIPNENIYLVEKVLTPISTAIKAILHESDNLVAETVFKLAGQKYSNTPGSAENGIKVLQAYCEKLGINTEDIRVVDGSGVSKNNLVTSDFMTNFLVAQFKNSPEYKEFLASAGEGTLKNRMLYMGDKLKAKTGTLSNISAITGYITTSSGKILAFNIMINDAKSKSSDKKMLEEYILRAISSTY
ncbi:MAG: D-alanyl-D-alanine carboxypeptidase/D-alanyl-D-alanine-endopeptidase [Cyanobacteria bacterium SIG32]|nr:D-alanyl-D-alanine carboxypeptidase/D-alanyl-D-alanine-endopeptidase [Cyanobacteria bacterium SIG32]